MILLILPPEAGRRQLLDLKVWKIIRQLSGEPTQQPIDYNQSSELSSSPFYLVVSPLCTRAPTHSPSASSKVSDASAPIITAGIICRFAKCRRLKPAEDQVERGELTRGIKTHRTLSRTNKTRKFFFFSENTRNTADGIPTYSFLIYASFLVQIYF